MQDFLYHRFPGFSDRYVAPEQLEAALAEFSDVASISSIGESVEHRPIYGLKIGDGPTRVLLWSQMHGNESTTTRALLDILLGYKKEAELKNLLTAFTLYMIPMLNPDGAQAYTRHNANDIDLNRDAKGKSQPEIQALFSVFDGFQPHYCLNLHDQRTRYGIGDPPVSVTLSFLAPAADEDKTITPSRRTAIALIGKVTTQLQKEESIGIGRYDDTFNPNCIGDASTLRGVPTILIEAGFYPGDYTREKTREYVYRAILLLLKRIAEGENTNGSLDPYFELPENRSCYADILIKNAYPDKSEDEQDLVLNYKEVVRNGTIDFIPEPLTEQYATEYVGHTVYDLKDPEDRKKVMSRSDLLHFFE